MVLGRLRGLFVRSGEEHPQERPTSLYGLDPTEKERIDTEEDPLRGFEAAVERHVQAARAEQSGDPERAIRLYQQSVAEGFVGSQPYERLASLYERRRAPERALQTLEAYLQLAATGRMPRGAQLSADRKTPELRARIERYRRQPPGSE
ncbi:MAG TPA: hypothetical protein VK869_04690 [Rubrobacteraceae bacterium]|nr:hypothetical protein [Rubrobacteraceae bacterium]